MLDFQFQTWSLHELWITLISQRAEYQTNLGLQSDLCPNFLWWEHAWLLYLQSSPPAPFSPTNNNLQNSIERGSCFHSGHWQTYHISCFLPFLSLPTPPSPLRTKSRTECSLTKIKDRKSSSKPPPSLCWNSVCSGTLRSLQKFKESELQNMLKFSTRSV